MTEPTDALELLREIYADLVQGAIPNADDPWWQKASAVLAKWGQPVAREPLTDAMVSRAGRALSDVYATECGVDKEDNWKIYGSDFIETARLVLEAAHGIKGGQHGTNT